MGVGVSEGVVKAGWGIAVRCGTVNGVALYCDMKGTVGDDRNVMGCPVVNASGVFGSDQVSVIHELRALSVLARIRLNGRPRPVVVAVFLFLSFLLLVVTGVGVVVFGAALVGAAVPVPVPFPVFSLMICLASCRGTMGVF